MWNWLCWNYQEIETWIGMNGRRDDTHWQGRSRMSFSTWGRKNIIISRTLCYHVPDSDASLLSPQRLFNMSKGETGRYFVEQDHSTLEFDGISPITNDYNSSNWLPIAPSRNMHLQSSPSVNLSVTSDENQNLNVTKKQLLHWHSRVGYHNLRDVELIRNPPFGSEQFLTMSKRSFEERSYVKYINMPNLEETLLMVSWKK